MGEIVLDGHKLQWHKDRIDAWLQGERIAPVTIDCALTRRCSYRCVYCYGQLQANEEQPMTKDVIFRFLDDAAEIGVKAISFISDGESTCSPHLYDTIVRGKANGLDMALATNGYMMHEEGLEDILSALTYLRFNISAADPGRYAEIHGCKKDCYQRVMRNIRKCVEIKGKNNLDVTIGLQMVLLPDFADQIIPLAELGKELHTDYFVIKHCSDDEEGSLAVDYSKYHDLVKILEQAETYTTDEYLVRAKWSKILSDGKRIYSRCYGPPFLMQFSGSGLVAPCGMLFNDRYRKYHIGNIATESYKKIWQSDRYWEVIDLIASDKFDARTMCGCLCIQHKINEFLWNVKQGTTALQEPTGPPPDHINFV